ncbi:HNH endonuclease [Mesorhizobium helmanticense]|uniref:HNH endonuclease n=1 Tax=Mesorhizobium helmanticense TaxID=1776423 RepID=A0A2T4J3L8_9HYPH|nr:HNH endonuclease [Mesorhizobium helmanticense]PTE12453.1 hypothetical protein C9427_00365 [Mesorhizobium helmanticense]
MKVIIPETGQIVIVLSTEELDRDLQAYRGEACSHTRQELRRLSTANGGYQVKFQCLGCGKRIGNPRKQQSDDDKFPLADKGVEERYENRRSQEQSEIYLKHARLQVEKQSSWWKTYNAYLQSEEWATKRELVLKRALGICEGCRIKKASEVHHLSYSHVGKEFLFELVAVCEDCHQRLHDEKQPDLDEFFDSDDDPEDD